MALVVVERSFETTEDGESVFDGDVSCFDLYQVKLVRSYLSPDRKRMICLFDAPDAESVRVANRQAGIPFERAWTAGVFHGPEDAAGTA